MLKKGFFRYILACILALMVIVPGYSASEKNTTSSVESASLPEIQAAYIYNLMKFTIWPQSAFEGQDSIRVGLIGSDDVTQVLKTQLAVRQAQNRKIILESVDITTKDFLSSVGQPFHILYICEGVLSKADIHSIKSQNTLLVGSYKSFTSEGGMVSVIYDKNKDKVVLYVNLHEVNKKTLSLSSKLLKIATIDE